MAFAVEISGIDDRLLAFAGYNFVEENEEFKVYRDKFMEDHIVRKSDSLLYVNEIDEAQTLSMGRVVSLPDD
jgi:hypothetical protein